MRQNNFIEENDPIYAMAMTVDSREQGTSLLIGGGLLFALAAAGLAIGYVSPLVQWAVTGFLSAGGLLFSVSGIGKLIARR